MAADEYRGCLFVAYIFLLCGYVRILCWYLMHTISEPELSNKQATQLLAIVFS